MCGISFPQFLCQSILQIIGSFLYYYQWKICTVFLFLGPSLPIIEDLRPAEFGLNVSWKSDVNSRQDKFEVVIRRIDTGKCSTNYGWFFLEILRLFLQCHLKGQGWNKLDTNLCFTNSNTYSSRTVDNIIFPIELFLKFKCYNIYRA